RARAARHPGAVGGTGHRRCSASPAPEPAVIRVESALGTPDRHRPHGKRHGRLAGADPAGRRRADRADAQLPADRRAAPVPASRCALTTSPTAWAAVPPTTEGASEPMRNQTHIHGASGPTNGRWAGLAFA